MYATAIGLLLLLQASQSPRVNSTFGAPDPEHWNRVYSSSTPSFTTAPNAFLAEMTRTLKPGRALDIGMGQGRNAVYLAKAGWDVTGFDISERGLEVAQKSAAAAAVRIKTVKSTMEDFDYGAAQWDLIVATYVGTDWREQAVRGLRPGGVLVVEAHFRTDKTGRAGFGPNELLKRFLALNLRVLRYEEADGQPDWSKDPGRVVRLYAQKPE